jgi:hypothetical protein
MKAIAASVTSGIQHQWIWHRKILLCLREILIRFRDEAGQPQGVAHGEHMSAGVLSVSDGEEHRERLIELSLEEVELAEVEAALLRLQNGPYDVSEMTGGPTYHGQEIVVER